MKSYMKQYIIFEPILSLVVVTASLYMVFTIDWDVIALDRLSKVIFYAIPVLSLIILGLWLSIVRKCRQLARKTRAWTTKIEMVNIKKELTFLIVATSIMTAMALYLYVVPHIFGINLRYMYYLLHSVSTFSYSYFDMLYLFCGLMLVGCTGMNSRYRRSAKEAKAQLSQEANAATNPHR